MADQAALQRQVAHPKDVELEVNIFSSIHSIYTVDDGQILSLE